MATHGRIQAMRAALAALVVWAAGRQGWRGRGTRGSRGGRPDRRRDAAVFARRDRSSPAGQIQCMGEAQQQWQVVMDGAYQRLLKDAPADAKRGWQDSQRHWLTWRKDVHLLKAVYDTTRGRRAMSSADLQLQPVRDRALALRGAADRYAPAPAAVPVAATAARGGG